MVAGDVLEWDTLSGWAIPLSSLFAIFLITSFSVSILERRGGGAVRFIHYSFFLATIVLAAAIYFRPLTVRKMEWGFGLFLFSASNFFAATAIISSGFLRNEKARN